jgi:hypothetical protein
MALIFFFPDMIRQLLVDSSISSQVDQGKIQDVWLDATFSAIV